MQFTYLGRTGVQVSRLCLGCMSYGDPAWRPWVLDRQAAMPFFRLAVESGINFFDTADMYSLGVSEEVTGAALREYARLEECVVATKVFNPMGPGPNMVGLSRKHVQQACEASLRRLGLDVIDLYQVHRFDKQTPIDEMLGGLELLVRQGKVRYIGASSVRRLAVRAGAVTVGTQRLGPLRDDAEPLQPFVPRGRARNDSALPGRAGGRDPLVAIGPGTAGRHAKRAGDQQSTTRAASDDYARKLYDHPSDWEVVEALQEVSARLGRPPAEVALAWLLSKPVVTAPIVGATKIEHLQSAIRGAGRDARRARHSNPGDPLPAACRTRLRISVRLAATRSAWQREPWGKRFALKSHRALPTMPGEARTN